MAQTIALRLANNAVERVYDIALSSVRKGSLPTLAHQCVDLAVFVEWARRKGLSVPVELSVLEASAPATREKMDLATTQTAKSTTPMAEILDAPADEQVRGWGPIGEYLKTRFGSARAPDPKTMKVWLGEGGWTKDEGKAVVLKRVLDNLPTPPSLK
jgi:hypothetical protein